MKPNADHYPIFEANQVLTNIHLNDVFNYLDEQQRLTRANLIGIGIVCGLELKLVGSTITLSKGCGITSEGYLIVENDVSLVSYRTYNLPDDVKYAPFKNKKIDPSKQYELWELFPTGEPNTTPLSDAFLKDKAVLLFLELKKEDLRNCSPNNCDDKGAKVTATVRRLLIKTEDLKIIIAEANKLGTGLTAADLETLLLQRLNLPDLRLPRYDVPATNPATSNQVLAAFLASFKNEKLADKTGTALTAAYEAFRPLVQSVYPNNPFTPHFQNKFDFLNNAPKTTTQVHFLQYYYNFFDHLLRAYDEVRQRGVELLCACCPSADMFPRHLMLGLLPILPGTNPELYRQHFLSSSALSNCEERTKGFVQLFQRLVEMVRRFTHTPQLPAPVKNSLLDTQIRVTPSHLSAQPLSDKAIPYYFEPDGTPPLFHLWSPTRTRRNKANQNLGYHAETYLPPAPAFVTNALRYDLEQYNFLRIEGHLGKNYQQVLRRLLALKAQYRLPIEVVALRTGAFNENVPVDLSKEDCRFQDLEALYDTLREELLCALCEGVRYLYDIAIEKAGLPGGTPQLPLLKKYAPNFKYRIDTVGAWYEKYLALIQSRPYLDVDQNKIDANSVLTVYCLLFAGTQGLAEKSYAHVVAVYYLSKLAEVLPASLNQLGYAEFENKYQDLIELIRYFRSDAATKISENLQLFVPQEDLIDHFDQVLFSCKLDPMKAIQEEYLRRIRELKRKQFLSHFLQTNPGIQHKAGVPLGGTFILVYHDEPPTIAQNRVLDNVKADLSPAAPTVTTISNAAILKSLSRISANQQLRSNQEIRFLIGSLTGQIPELIALPAAPEDDKIIAAAVGEFDNGTVIADFYLPYLCCSDCSPVQFVLPKTPPVFTVQTGCTNANANNQAEVTVTPHGGVEPYSVKVDNKDYQPLSGALLLAPGQHTLVIQDAEATESAPQNITVADPIIVGILKYDCIGDNLYIAAMQIKGGTPPYFVKEQQISGDSFQSEPIKSGIGASIEVKDNKNCTAKIEVQHTCCDLPCNGQSRLCAYRLWVQPPLSDSPYETYGQDQQIRLKFRYNHTDIELPDALNLVNASAAALNQGFHETIGSIIKKLNAVINQTLNDKFGKLSKSRLVLSYRPGTNDPFGILWIEYFDCETFYLEFGYTFAKPKPPFALTCIYTNEDASFNGAIFINRRLDNKETRVPAFDCRERNQCTGGDYTKLCQGPDPKPSFFIEPLGNNRFQLGKKDNLPASEIAARVWDIFTAQPTEPFYVGEKVEVQLQNPSGRIRLTAITTKGCFGISEQGLGQ